MTTPLRISFDVACPAEHAFRTWQTLLPHYQKEIAHGRWH